MRRSIRPWLAVGLATVCALDRGRADPPLAIVAASFVGTAEGDDLQDAAAGPDGTLYIVGNTAAAAADLPGGIEPLALGSAVKEQRCGRGFVARLSPDCKKLLGYTEFAPGVVLLTTVRAGAAGVYLGGYASEGLSELIADRPGLFREYPLMEEVKALRAADAEGKKDPIAGRPGLGRYGAPCVLRLGADLRKLEGGTYLEGWQQVWDKKRVAKFGKEIEGHFQEYFWQPTHIEILEGGDAIVCHDGGYFRPPTDRDRAVAKDDVKQLDRLCFYDVPDYLSRLSGDLARRSWKRSLYTPAVDPEVAAKVKDGWSIPHYGNPRTHRMRLDKAGNVYLCGWSASATSKEPWWSPYLWKLEAEKGDVLWRAYQYDPMSGGGNRMGGSVSDTAVVTVALDDDDNLLTGLIADGGNTVMGLSPKADGTRFEGVIKGGPYNVKLVHFWGQVHRLDGKTRAGIGGARIGPWAWVTDLAPLPGRHVLAVGRYDGKFGFTDDAWANDSPIDNPNGFLRVYSPEFDLRFGTALPGVVPFAVRPIGDGRFVVVGRAETGLAPVKDAAFPKAKGKGSGYFLVVQWDAEKAGGK